MVYLMRISNSLDTDVIFQPKVEFFPLLFSSILLLTYSLVYIAPLPKSLSDEIAENLSRRQ